MMDESERRLQRWSVQIGLGQLSHAQLLQTYAAITEELRHRGIARTANNPVADYTEWLVCEKLGLQQEKNSNAGYDATTESGEKIEIKSRRLTRHNGSVQLSAIRNLDHHHFDYLVGVIYEVDFTIRYAVKIPHRLIASNSRFSKHSNAHFLNLTPAVLKQTDVENITEMLIR